MNTRQLLVLSLIACGMANNVVAMEETEMQRAMRERKEKMQRQLEAQRALETEAAKAAAEAMPDKAEAEPIAPATQPIVFGPNDNNAPAPTNSPRMEPVIAPITPPAPAYSPEMEPVIERAKTPSKDKEEDNGPSDEELAQDFNRAEQRRVQTLGNTHASMQEYNESILRKQRENILAREIADTLSTKASEAQMRGRLEQYAAALVSIADTYPGDAKFTPIINILNARSAQLELELQLLAQPQEIALWEQLGTLLDQLVIENFDNAQFAESLMAQHAAYQEARQMIFEGHKPSGNGIIDDFEEIDRIANDQLIAQHMDEQLQEQDRAEQMAQGEAEARLLHAQIEAQNREAQIAQGEAAAHRLHAQFEAQNRAAQIAQGEAEARRLHAQFETQNREAQIAQGEAAARRLQEEFNRGNQAPAPAPGPNDPDNDPDNTPGPRGPNTPRDRQPANAQPTTQPTAKKFDLMAFMNNPQFMQGLVAVAGVSLVSFIVYKVYDWFTKKKQATQPKKQEATRTKKGFPARSKRRQEKQVRFAQQ